MFIEIGNTMRKWLGSEDAVAAAEFGLVFPVMFTMIVGIWDLGNGILANQKAIAASHVVVDLICRQDSVSDAELAQAFQAGALAMMPFDTSDFTADVASVEYDADDDPQLLWQEDSGGGTGDPTLVDKTAGLGMAGDGTVAVQVTYLYSPLFSGTIIGDINMTERVFSKGRNTSLVARD